MVHPKLAETGREKGGGPVPAPGPGGRKAGGAFAVAPYSSFLFRDGSEGREAAEACERGVPSEGLGGFRLLACEWNVSGTPVVTACYRFLRFRGASRGERENPGN